MIMPIDRRQPALVARREVRERLRTKAFRWSTAIIVVAAVVGVVVPKLVAGGPTTTRVRIGVTAAVAPDAAALADGPDRSRRPGDDHRGDLPVRGVRPSSGGGRIHRLPRVPQPPRGRTGRGRRGLVGQSGVRRHRRAAPTAGRALRGRSGRRGGRPGAPGPTAPGGAPSVRHELDHRPEPVRVGHGGHGAHVPGAHLLRPGGGRRRERGEVESGRRAAALVDVLPPAAHRQGRRHRAGRAAPGRPRGADRRRHGARRRRRPAHRVADHRRRLRAVVRPRLRPVLHPLRGGRRAHARVPRRRSRRRRRCSSCWVSATSGPSPL